MSVRKWPLILLSLSLFNTGQLFSQYETLQKSGLQKGFIIKYSGDTITGTLNKPGGDALSNVVWFKPKNGEKSKSDPFNIAGFGNYITGKIYRTVEVPTKTGPKLSFVQVLIEGEYGLFYYKSFESDHFLIRDLYGKITDLGTNISGDNSLSSFKQNLKLAFSDTPEILSESDRVKPKKRSLTGMLQKYYDNKGLQYIDYSGFSKSYTLGIVAGTSFDRFIPSSSETKLNSQSTPYPYLGISMHFSNPNTGRGVFLQSTLGLKSYHYYYTDILEMGEVFNESFIKSVISTTKTGLSIESVLPGAIKPFIEGGAIFSFLLFPEYNNYNDFLSFDNLIALSHHDHDLLHPAFYYGVFLRTGISYKIQKMNSLRLSIGYDLLKGKGGAGINSFDLALTYKIKFR